MSEPAPAPSRVVPIGARERRWRPGRPVDLARTLSPLRRGTGDPTVWFDAAGVFWWGCRTPDGPGALALRHTGGEMLAQAWGPGSDWLLDGAPELAGDRDDWTELDVSGHPVLREVARRHAGVRLTRTRRVLDALAPACLEQRVTHAEARHAWRRLVREHGERAPGPGPADGRRLWIAPAASALRQVTDWQWHRYQVDPRRARAVRAAATVADRLEECVTLAGGNGCSTSTGAAGCAAARARLQVVPGVGEWTAAEVAVRAWGDPDAVSVGDFHIANLVGHVLTGAPRTDDATMLELLEPWAGQRARIVLLARLSGIAPPKYGPRFSPNDISRI